MLHYFAKNFNLEKTYHGLFKNHKKLFYELDQEANSPLDVLITRFDGANLDNLINLMQELAEKYLGYKRFRMNFDTFKKLCAILKDSANWPILKIFIENGDLKSM